MPDIIKYFRCFQKNPLNMTIVLIAVLFFSVLLLPACPWGKAVAADITLAGDYNSEPDLAGYKLYLGNFAHQYIDR